MGIVGVKNYPEGTVLKVVCMVYQTGDREWERCEKKTIDGDDYGEEKISDFLGS